MTPADVVTKAINNLTQALKGKSNTKGLQQIEALQKLENILNNVPETAPILREQPIPTPKRVTVDQTTKPPQEIQPRELVPSPRVSTPIKRARTATPIHTVTVDKLIANKPTQRVQKVPKDTRPARIKMRERIRKHLEAKTMARIPQQNTYLRQTTRSNEQAQLIHDKETNTYLNYHQLLRHPKYKDPCDKSAAKEFGCLAKGLKDERVKETDTIKFIHKDQVPAERMKNVMYGSSRCNYKPNKEEKECTRLTAGGDRINYPDNCGTQTADMTLFKILINSILSTPNAKCIMMDIKDFYLRTPMKRPEYMRLKITDIPEEIIEQYKLKLSATPDRYVYCEITQGMYGLPQAGIIAQELLEKRLAEYGYYQSKIINGLWKHKTRPICFCLIIDDFAVKYVNREDANHLINAIRKYYPMTVDEKATKYIGLTIEWEYKKQKAHIHMPGYLQKAFTRFKHKMPVKIQNSLHPHVIPQYGAKMQHAKEDNESPPLSK
jgi:hypothetical protein